MPRFSYIAKSQQGGNETGFLEAKDERELADTLRQEGLFLVSSRNDSRSQGKSFSPLSAFQGVSSADKLFFIRNLRVMTSSGISLPRAIGSLAAQTKNKKFKKALSEIEGKVIKGQNLSDSLREYPEIFPDLFQSMVKVGEESGTMEEVLKNLSQQLEKEAQLKSSITGALIYPAVVVSAMVGIGFLMLIVIVPQLAATFAELNLTLPLTTRVVIGAGTFLRQKWYLLPFIVIALVFAISRILRTEKGKRFFDGLFLKLPVLSGLIRETNSAVFSRTLSSLISSGIPVVRALEIISGTMGNIYFRESLKEAGEKVRKGARLSETLQPYSNLYLPIVIQMIEVGEETGETSQILNQLSDFLEEEVTNATKNLASLIEPLLMLLVGAVVGFFAISMLQPMYSMLEGIK